MAADEELLGGASPQLESLRAGRRGGRRVEDLGGVGAPGRERQRIGQTNLQLALLVHFERMAFEGTAQQLRRTLEGERLGRLRRGPNGEARAPLGLTSALPVNGERLEIVAPERLEREREPLVTTQQLRRLEMRAHRHAYSIVVGLDRIGRADPFGADQVGASEQRRRFRELGRFDASGAGQHRLRQRPSRDRHELDERTRQRPERRDSHPQCVIEPHVSRLAARRHAVSDERVDEERMSGGLFGDGDRIQPSAGAVLQEQTGEPTRIRRRQVVQMQVAHVAERAAPGVEAAGRRASALGGLAHRGDEEQRRRVGRSHDLGEQREAVSVRPLQIVDDQHQRPAVAQSCEQLAQLHEDAAAAFLRIADVVGRLWRASEGFHVEQHGEGLRDQRGHPRQDRRRVDRGELAKAAAERVDDLVERLVGDRLALVAASRQNHRVWYLLAEVAREVADQGALADARLSVDQMNHGLARAHVAEALLEHSKLGLASDEGRATDGGRVAGNLRLVRSQPTQNLSATRSRARVDAQELGA